MNIEYIWWKYARNMVEIWDNLILSREQTYPLFLWKIFFFGYVSCCEHRL